MCREGGCGLCVVMATKTNPLTGEEEHFAINSVCFFLLLKRPVLNFVPMNRQKDT